MVCTSGGSFQSQPTGSADKRSTCWESCRVSSSTALLPSHLDDLSQRTALCQETQRNEVAALLTEFADVFAHSAHDLARTCIVKNEICPSRVRLVHSILQVVTDGLELKRRIV